MALYGRRRHLLSLEQAIADAGLTEEQVSNADWHYRGLGWSLLMSQVEALIFCVIAVYGEWDLSRDTNHG